MSNPYVGEIRMFGGNFAPAGWMLCEGQLLPISEYETLFNLIGTTYGGDGQSTFALPDLQSRVPIHMGSGYVLGETGGVETVTLSVAQIPSHTHPFMASSSNAGSRNPGNQTMGGNTASDIYAEDLTPTPMAAQMVGAVGGSQPHTNLQPFLCVNFIISLYGIYPQPS